MRHERSTEPSRLPNGNPRYYSPLEALMSTAPGRQIEVSQVELLELRDVIEDALESALTEQEQWIFNEVFVARTSLRKLGLPKTTVARIRDRAVEKMAAALQDHPMIRAYLKDQQ